MFYKINFYTSIRKGMELLAEGPELDIKSLWTQFKNEFNAKVGCEPDIFCWQQTADYVTARLNALREYQARFGIHEDLESMFFLLLIREYGFRKLPIMEVQLE